MTIVNISVPSSVPHPGQNEPLCGTGDRPSVIELLSTNGMFGRVDPQSRQQALLVATAGAQLRRHRAGTELFTEGHAAEHWLVVQRGEVQVMRVGCDGTERVFARMGSGQTVAELAMLLAHGRYPSSARAVGDTRAWWCSRRALRDAVASHHALALTLLEGFSARVHQRMDELGRLAAVQKPQRLASWLLAQHALQGQRVQLPLTQRALAVELGMRAETLSRLLGQWRESGWLRGGRQSWTVIDEEAIRRLSEPA